MKKPWVYNEGKVKFYGKDQNLLNKLNYEGNYLDGVTIEKKSLSCIMRLKYNEALTLSLYFYNYIRM